MNTGLTIAFICGGNDHSTMINYNSFGHKYWDDTPSNGSKIGYYFAYYSRQKYVYIHKIIDILDPSQRPSDMNWSSNRQILCLSNQIKQFTWDEWINGIGFGAPYTPRYRMCQTSAWSFDHIATKYPQFNFTRFCNSVVNENRIVLNQKDIRRLELIACRNSIQEHIDHLVKEREQIDAEIDDIQINNI